MGFLKTLFLGKCRCRQLQKFVYKITESLTCRMFYTLIVLASANETDEHRWS